MKLSRSIALAAAVLGLAYVGPLIAQQPVPPRIIVFVIDDLNIDFRDTPHVRALVKTMGEQVVGERDLFGMVSTGPSSISVDLTSDHTRIGDAAGRITGQGLKPK